MAAHQAPHPWDSPGKNTGVGCHFLLQCTKVKNESEVAQLCLTLSDPMDCSLPGSSVHGIFQARVLEWGAIPLWGSTKMFCLVLFFVSKHYQYGKWSVSHSVMSDSWSSHSREPALLFCLWNSPGKNTGVGSHFRLQRIFPNQGLNRVSCMAGRFLNLLT